LSLWLWRADMRFLTVISLSVLGALGLASCVDNIVVSPRQPSAPAISASTAASPDFDYIAHPPNVQVSSGTVAPTGLPFCRSGLVCY